MIAVNLVDVDDVELWFDFPVDITIEFLGLLLNLSQMTPKFCHSY